MVESRGLQLFLQVDPCSPLPQFPYVCNAREFQRPCSLIFWKQGSVTGFIQDFFLVRDP